MHGLWLPSRRQRMSDPICMHCRGMLHHNSQSEIHTPISSCPRCIQLTQTDMLACMLYLLQLRAAVETPGPIVRESSSAGLRMSHLPQDWFKEAMRERERERESRCGWWERESERERERVALDGVLSYECAVPNARGVLCIPQCLHPCNICIPAMPGSLGARVLLSWDEMMDGK